MEKSADLQGQWSELVQKKNELARRMRSLKRRYENMAGEEDGRISREDKHFFKENIEALQEEISLFIHVVQQRKILAKNCRLALAKKHPRATYLRTVKNLLSDFEQTQKRGEFIHPITMKLIEDARHVLTLELQNVQAYLGQRNLPDLQEIAERELVIGEARKWMAQIQQHYHLTRKQAKEDLDKAVAALEEHLYTMRQWATQDRSHVEWISRHEASWRNEMIRAYQQRFPEENLNGLAVDTTIDTGSRCNKPRRCKRQPLGATPPPEAAKNHEPPWKLFFAHEQNGKRELLPLDEDGFVAKFQALGIKPECRQLDPRIIHAKLIALTRLDPHQRWSITKHIRERQWHHWRSWAIAQWRLVLRIDEELRQITFIPFKRDEDYLKPGA